ncbi:MAG: carbon storage regulator [Proteobacteria bacterium]|nr:MAG: carbon storage regulator [Pseudomonadota bacterium]
MLILTRRVNETLVITIPDGRRIEVEVLGFKGNQVRVGVSADTDIVIHRGEVQARIDAEQTAEQLASREK